MKHLSILFMHDYCIFLCTVIYIIYIGTNRYWMHNCSKSQLKQTNDFMTNLLTNEGWITPYGMALSSIHTGRNIAFTRSCLCIVYVCVVSHLQYITRLVNREIPKIGHLGPGNLQGGLNI